MKERIALLLSGPGTILCALLVIFPFQPGHASRRFSEYPVRPASDYANKVAQAGLIVAIEPLEDRGQQKLYFEGQLGSRGILPVFIVIQNTSAAETYLFDKSAVGLADANDLSGKGARKTASQLGSGGLLDLSLVNEVTDTREDMLKRQLRSTTLTPGASVHGFIYVPVSTDTPRKQMHLEVPLTNVQSGETEVVNLLF